MSAGVRRMMRGRGRTYIAAALLLALCASCVVAAAARGADDVEKRRQIHLLIRDLGDRKAAVRADAERRLEQMGDAAVPDLLLALENRHLAVTTMAAEANEVARARAAKVLGATGGARAGAQLVQALADKSALVRRAAAGAVGALRCKEAVPELLKLASGADPALAGDAVLALGSIGDKAATKELVGVLAGAAALKERYGDDDAVARVRSAAAFALGMLGDAAGVPELLRALRDGDARVREHADLALRKMSGKNLGFKADAPDAEREGVVKAWEALWQAKLEKR